MKKWKSLTLCAVMPLLLQCQDGHQQDILGMAVEEVLETAQFIRARTTGAEFIFDKQKNFLECYQRIPIHRKVVTVFGIPCQNLRVCNKSPDVCQIAIDSQSTSHIIVSQESLLNIPIERDTKIVIAGSYQPEYLGQEGPHFLLPDQNGGVGLYCLGNTHVDTTSLWNSAWQITYLSATTSRLLLSVFPPRPFNWNQSFETVLHSFSSKRPYPSNEELKNWREIGSILTLHSWIWQGEKGGSQYGIEQDGSWSVTEFEPKSATELIRVVKSAHLLGMKVIPYMSPFYFRGGDIEDFVEAVEECMKKYNFDGVYFDGLPRDIIAAYDVTRKVRKVIGDRGILYIHSTTLPLNEIYCPFIDCYATYILRGEHRRLSEDSARWYISGYNLSNSIGTFCYDTQRPTLGMIELLLRVNARLPFWVQDGMWRNINYHLTEKEKELFQNEYIPRINIEKQAKRFN